MSSNIIRTTDLDVNKITFSDLRTLDNGGKMINIGYNGGKFLLQMPQLIASYGLSRWEADRPGAYDKLNLDLSLAGYDGTNALVTAFFEKMSAFDEKVVDTALVNSKNWFKKNITSKDIILATYTPIVKFSKDGEGNNSTKWPPVVRLNIPRNRQGEIDVEIYDADRKKVDFENVNFKRAQVTAIVQVSSIWLVSGKFGITMRVQQMKVAQAASIFSGFAFIADSDEGEDAAE